MPPCAGWNCSIQIWASGDWKALGARRINGTESIRILSDISTVSLSATDWNKLTVIAEGDKYSIFVNNAFVRSFSDSTYKSGTLVLASSTGATAFNYVRVYNLPKSRQ